MKFKIIIFLILCNTPFIKPRIIKISKWQAPNNPKLNILIFNDIHKTNNLRNEVSIYKTILKSLKKINCSQILVEDPDHPTDLDSYKTNTQLLDIITPTAEKTLKKKYKKKYSSSKEYQTSISLLSFFKFQNNPTKIFDILNIEKPKIDCSNMDIKNIDSRQFINFIYQWKIIYYILDHIKLHIKRQINSENPIKKIVNSFKEIGLQKKETLKIKKLIKQTGNEIWDILDSENKNERFNELSNLFTSNLLNILNIPSNKNLIIDFLYDDTIKILKQYIKESFNQPEQAIYIQVLDEIKYEKKNLLNAKILPLENKFPKLFKFLEINALRIIQKQNKELTQSQTIAIFMGHTHCCFLEKYLIKLKFKKINEIGINKIKKQIKTSIKNKLNQKINNTNFDINNFFDQKILEQQINYKILLTCKYLISSNEIKAIFTPNPYQYDSLNNIFNIDYILTNNIFLYPNISWAFNLRSQEFEIVTWDDFNLSSKACSFLPDYTIDYIIENYPSYDDFIIDLQPIKEELMEQKRLSRKRKNKASQIQKRNPEELNI